MDKGVRGEHKDGDGTLFVRSPVDDEVPPTLWIPLLDLG